MRRPTLLLALLLLPWPLAAQGRFQRAVNIGEVDSVWSATLQEQRPYLVYTPPSYGDTTLLPQRYPVLYLLDGDAHFHSVSGLVQILGTGVNGTFVLPEMIVVAIPNTNRTRDLTPTKSLTDPDGSPTDAFRESGGGPAFLTFLETELVPHIEARYRASPYRVFVGHSFGGITVLDALYTRPGAFNAYVAIDPSLWWDGRALLWKAKDYFATARLEERALYVAHANTLSPTDTAPNLHHQSIAQFHEIMEAFDRSGIRYAFKYYGDDSHGSVPLIAEYDALRFIFDAYDVPLQRVVSDPAVLAEHFEGVTRALGVPFTPPEGMLRLLGQVLMAQDTTAAIAVGEMRVARYPENYRGYEFLGDAWAAAGDVARARGYYEEALRRSGGEARVRGKLEKLGG